MKKRDVIKKLEENNYRYLRPGHNHDIYSNGNIIIAIPRHREINELTAKKILKEAGLL